MRITLLATNLRRDKCRAESRSAFSTSKRLWTTRNSFPRYISVPACVSSPKSNQYINKNESTFFKRKTYFSHEKVIFTSSDKAVNPTNVMGTSKLMGERLMTAANSNQHDDGPIFTSTRFGNVLGSSGSVVPIFHKQIAKGGPVTLTQADMTRFVMSIGQAVRLVVDSANLAQGGDVFITKMPVIRIKDLADIMIAALAPVYGHRPEAIEITEIGVKPGEKLYEELMNHEEMRRAVELPRYFSILPAFRGLYKDIPYNYPDILSTTVTKPYNSSYEKPMSKKALADFLKENDLTSPSDFSRTHPDKRYWPGDKE